MEITTATLEDIPALAALLGELFALEVEFAPDAEAQRRGLACIVANPEIGIVLVARDGGTTVGMANILFTLSTALGARVAILDDLIVTASARGQGIGGMLIERGIALAKEQGCKRMTLMTDRINERAQRLYARHGFVASSMLPLRLMLD